jgi:thioredoxin domain-containing protein 3
MIQLMNSNASDMGVTLFMPHVIDFATRKTLETAKWLSLVNRGQKIIELTPELMKTLSYQLENPIDEKILEHVYGKNVLICLWYTDPRNPITQVLAEFVKGVSEPRSMYDDDGIPIPGAFEPSILESLVIKLEDNDDEKGNEETKEDVVAEKIISRESSLIVETSAESNIEMEEKNNELVIPPVWTPVNQTGNAVFMYTLFRHVSNICILLKFLEL